MIKTCHLKIVGIIFFVMIFFILANCAKKNIDPLILPPNFSDLPISETSEK